MKTLILGQIPDDFSPGKHIPLGPFCFVGKENVFPNWEQIEFLPEVIKSGEQLKHWDNITNKYLNVLVLEYADIFNKKFELNFSFKFWYQILNTYLLCLIQSVYVKEQQFASIINKYQHYSINVQLVKDNIIWKFKNTEDFVLDMASNSLLNEWLYSRVAEKILPSGWTSFYVDKSNLHFPANKKPKVRLENKIINLVLSDRCQKIYGFNIVERILLDLYVRYKRPIKISDKDQSYFETKNQLKFNVDINNLISRTLPFSISNCNLLIRKYSKRKLKKGKVNIGSQLLLYNDNLKILNALRNENGEVTIGVQHGGHNYGSSKTINTIANAEFIHHTFISWGYTEHEDYNNFYPMPSPLLSKSLNKHKQKNEKILLIGTRPKVYIFRYEGCPRGNQWVDYRKEKVRLIKNINQSAFKDLYYRPYFNDANSFRDASYYKDKIPDLKIHNGKSNSFHKELFGIKLLILDHPGTTMNIAFAANVPTICFWQKDFFPFCRQAIPYFEELEKVGILFSGDNYAEAAANKVNEIADNVQAWWQQPDVQTAKNRWAKNYALASKNWRWKWIKTLWNLK